MLHGAVDSTQAMELLSLVRPLPKSYPRCRRQPAAAADPLLFLGTLAPQHQWRARGNVGRVPNGVHTYGAFGHPLLFQRVEAFLCKIHGD